MHHRRCALLDPYHGGLLMDNAAKGFHCSGFAENQIERVDMSAASVQHATDIALGVDYTADRLGIEQFELVMAVTLLELFLLLQLPELSSIHGGKDTAILQVAVDA